MAAHTTTFLLLLALHGAWGAYYGREIGQFRKYAHDVSGTVYAVNYTHIFIENFNYDGTAPDAFLWIGLRNQTTSLVSWRGIIVPDENGRVQRLGSYKNANLLLALPRGVYVGDFRWISVWCRQFRANFGDVAVSDYLRVPNPQSVGNMTGLAHRTASDVVIVETDRTIYITSMYYDGYGPDAFFILGRGQVGSPGFIKVPHEPGSVSKAPRYSGQSIRLTLPENTSFIGQDYFALYCIKYTENFGYVNLPSDLNVPPYLTDPQPAQTPSHPHESSLANCESLSDRLNVGWEVAGDRLTMQLISVTGANEYAAFGLSGSSGGGSMLYADVTATSYRDGTARAHDLYLNDYAQCSNGRGACADTTQGGTDDVTIVDSSRTDGVTMVTFSRRLNTGDPRDRAFTPSTEQYVVWALGPLRANGVVTKHDTKGSQRLLFGRPPTKTCGPLVLPPTGPPPPAWPASHLSGRDTRTFTFHLGPAGGARGYTAITGVQSWGIAYYVNDLLIPELTLRRGVTYTFHALTGDDPARGARYHPVYVTDDPQGGYVQRAAADRQNYAVFAGLNSQGQPLAGAVGRYCEYRDHDQADPPPPEQFDTFAAYAQTLELACESGQARGTFTFTPDQRTPDLVWYQCYTHLNLGYMIHIVDSFDGELEEPSASFENCESLHEQLNVSWTVNQTHLDLQLTGRIGADEYMAFGLSGLASRPQMINADVVVASYDETDGPAATDYFLSGRYKCSNGNGACPDTESSGVNNIVLTGGTRREDVTTVRVSRPLYTGDSKDRAVVNWAHSVVWAIGPLDDQRRPNRHTLRTSPSDTRRIHFGRTPVYNCDLPTMAPTAAPAPTMAPTAAPAPTMAPTAAPAPTMAPTATPVPTMAPTCLLCLQPLASFENCESLHEQLNVSWTVNQTHLDLQLTGRIGADEYMAFGLSGLASRPQMINADVVVASYDETDGPAATDYFLSGRYKCSNGNGACPDTESSGVNNIVLTAGARRDSVTIVRVSRPLYTGDSKDRAVVNWAHSVVWAIGPLDDQRRPNRHTLRTSPSDTRRIHFGRTPVYNCDLPTMAPTAAPAPNMAPTAAPAPTMAPTAAPAPTMAPTAAPAPTMAPTCLLCLQPPASFENCESLHEQLNVSWTVNQTHLDLQLTGRIGADGYMAFGLSGLASRPQMRNADVVVASYDETDGPAATDYFLSGYYKCSNGNGACPDTESSGVNNIIVTGGTRREGVTIVRVSRPLYTGDSKDRAVVRWAHSVVWAIGLLDDQRRPNKHTLRTSSSDTRRIHFGRTPVYNCDLPTMAPTAAPAPNMAPTAAPAPNMAPTAAPAPTMAPTAAPALPWEPNQIDGTTVYDFTVRLGPTGGDRGYKAITNLDPWGLVFYINRLLIPELTLVRGYSYQFKVETGNNTANTARYHPFYISTDPIGGYLHHTEQEKQEIQVFTGIEPDGSPSSYAVGKYCEYVSGGTEDTAATFEEYASTLTLNCDSTGTPGYNTWRVPLDAPDILYYQCYNHRHFGWRIRVVDRVQGMAQNTVAPIPADKPEFDAKQEDAVGGTSGSVAAPRPAVLLMALLLALTALLTTPHPAALLSC